MHIQPLRHICPISHMKINPFNVLKKWLVKSKTNTGVWVICINWRSLLKVCVIHREVKTRVLKVYGKKFGLYGYMQTVVISSGTGCSYNRLALAIKLFVAWKTQGSNKWRH